ncbi:hypothetical protein ZOSMA_183G00180 [Zostera marina]|uniref:Uncharacterized protein n=1 Tax=Zostera marina TaxID=29655 RepID=A0A0K9PST1_ZOSMR|nr:hypothetical protein ZOSMA_183G00180 [Zostera marina]
MINTKEIELMLKKLMFLYIKECIEVKSNLLKNEQVGVPVNEVYNENNILAIVDDASMQVV